MHELNFHKKLLWTANEANAGPQARSCSVSWTSCRQWGNSDLAVNHGAKAAVPVLELWCLL